MYRFASVVQQIEALNACHSENKLAKFWGKCNEQKWNLDRCLRQEKAINRERNFEKAKKERARFAEKRKQDQEDPDFQQSGMISAVQPSSSQERHRRANVLLGVSGSVATIKLKELYDKLAATSAEVKIVSTEAARHFFDESWELKTSIYGDEDDWRSWSKVGDEVMHIQLRKWADVLVIAPLSANTLAKLAQGICDNLLTCIVRAWDIDNSALVLAPAMNTFMWNNPITKEHIQKVTALYDASFVPPVEKTLACGDTGVGAMAHVDDIVDMVSRQIDCLNPAAKSAEQL